MRNLSDILNPAPKSELLKQNVDSETHREELRKGHARFGSLSSPLHALALAAEEHRTPPMNSPTSPHTTSASFPTDRPEPRRNSASSPRPGSSHFTHPQSSLLSPTDSAHLDQKPPPRLEHNQQLNHHGVARRLSDIADGHAVHLPPLHRSSGEDREYPATGYSIESYSIFSHQGGSRQEEQEVRDQNDTKVNDRDKMNYEANTSLISVPVTSPVPIEQPQLSGPQREAEVKTEHAGATPTLMSFPSPALTGGASSPQQGAQSLQANSTKSNLAEGQLTPPPAQAAGALLYPPQKPPNTANRKKPQVSPNGDKKIEKKGTASLVKKPSRRKNDPKSKDGTPFSQRSETPISSRASKTPAPSVGRKQASATPLHSSPPPSSTGAGQDGDDDDGNSELFCICRKPDDHTWMIACDGPCEDWFHGRCVNMDEEKGALIDKYFCPNCSAKGIGETTWKRMCRLPDCNRPVRVSKSPSSKYCSDEHGRRFMRRKIAPGDRSNSEDDDKYPPKRKKKKTNRNSIPSQPSQPKFAPNVDGNNEEEGTCDISGGDGHDSGYDQSHLRGGLLRPSELKALAYSVSSISDFRRLGSPLFANGDPVDNTTKEISASNTLPQKIPPIPYTPAEKAELEVLSTKRAALKRNRALLDSKEKFLSVVKARTKVVLEDLKAKDKSLKDICGYDSRLSWQDEQFDAWKNSAEGIATLNSGASGSLKSTEDNDVEIDDANVENGRKSPSNLTMESGPKFDEVQMGYMCVKKRCERHRQWYKVAVQDIAFEKDKCRVEMRGVAREEKAILEGAQVRWLENGGVVEPDDLVEKTVEVNPENEEAMDGIREG